MLAAIMQYQHTEQGETNMRVPTTMNLNIPVWALFLGSALVWYVSALSQHIPLLGQYWLGWQYRFEPWQWVAAVGAVWALVVLALLQDVRKYKKLGQVLAVVLVAFYVQKGYVEGSEFRQLMGAGLILLWFVLRYGLAYGMYALELTILTQRSARKTDFPACTVVIYDDVAYKVAESTLWILLWLNVAIMGVYFLNPSQPQWRCIALVVVGMLGLLHTVLGRRRWVRMLAERRTQGRAYLSLQQEGLTWQWTQMRWTKSRYLPRAELRCQLHQDSLAWRDVTAIFSVRGQEDSPKQPPPLVQVHSDVEDEQGQAVCLALPYERTRFEQAELLQLLQRTQTIALSFKPLPSGGNQHEA